MIYPSAPHHYYGYQQGQRYYFLNVLEELDAPGEWVLDAHRGFVYFWPPAPIEAGDVTVSLLKEPMVLLNGASHVQLQGLVFEASRACAIKIRGGTDNLIAGSIIRNIDCDTSVIIDGGTRNGIRSCDIYDVGSTGVRIVGGDRKTLTPAGNFAINNHIYRFGGITQAFNGGVFLQGVGNVVSHNRIHDAPASGIQYYGNDHVIEYNELFDLAHETGDIGGINTGADYSEMGTMIRYNYIHDTHGYGEGGFRGIYLDLPGSQTTIFGNILSNVDIGVFFNSGRDNVVQNNVFYNCHPSVNIYIWPHASYFHPGGAWKIVEKLQEIHYAEPPYSTRYPGIASYLDTLNLGMPYGHKVTNNVSDGGTWLDLSAGMNFTHVLVENNVVGDSLILVYTRRWTPDLDPYHIGYAAEYTRRDSKIVGELKKRGNVVSDPHFIDPAHGDFHLREDSPAWKAGFAGIPIDKIGLVVDEFRPTTR
jgi:parallel beta-helix repeat protein